jgi:hypothetical protein
MSDFNMRIKPARQRRCMGKDIITLTIAADWH